MGRSTSSTPMSGSCSRWPTCRWRSGRGSSRFRTISSTSGRTSPLPTIRSRERLRIVPEQTEWLEHRCDEVNAGLEPLNSFVLPGGTPAAAHLHVARTVCRRAERLTVACGAETGPEVVRYLNRLSDLLFILARGCQRRQRAALAARPLPLAPGLGREPRDGRSPARCPYAARGRNARCPQAQRPPPTGPARC